MQRQYIHITSRKHNIIEKIHAKNICARNYWENVILKKIYARITIKKKSLLNYKMLKSSLISVLHQDAFIKFSIVKNLGMKETP